MLDRSLARISLAACVLLVSMASPSMAQRPTPSRDPGFTIPDVLSPPFPYALTAARRADRVAWIENERGMRNVYTAAAPDFRRVRLTATVEDDAVDLSSVQLSDDGRVAVFVRGHPRNARGQIGNQGSHAEGGRREIWAVATDGSRPAWRVGAASNAVLSPDGAWVLHVEDGQIHRKAVDPGTADPAAVDAAPPLFVTLGTNGSPVWSPDGRRIAFVTSRFDQRQYFPTQGRAITHSFVAVYDVERRRVTYLTPSVDRDTGPVWSPDGTRIAFLRRPGLPFAHFATAPLTSVTRDQVPEDFRVGKFAGGSTLSFWVVDVATGEGREVWHNPAGDSLLAEVNAVRWVGDRLVFLSELDGWQHAYSVPVDGGDPAAAPTLLTPGAGEVEDLSPSPDGAWLYFTSNVGDPDRRHLWRVPVAGGRAEQLTEGSAIETTIRVLATEGVAALQSGPRSPLSVAVLPAGRGGQARVVGPTPPPEFPAARHVEPQTVELTAEDGGKSHAVLFLPSDLRPGEKRPAVLYIHGGGGRFVLGYPDQDNGFYHMSYGVIQYLVNKGYIVAEINYRGGSGPYGRAFRNPAGYREQGVSEYRDVLAAGRYLAGRPDVDPERLGVWGLSYGGWLTGQALSRNPELFKAGAIFAGVMHRSTSLDPSDLAFQSSPSYNIGQWTAPTLVVHGDDDRNVEFSQTVGLINLFRARGVPHRLIVFPDDTHYYGYFSRWIEAFQAVDGWFDERLLTRTARTARSGGE